MDSLSSLPVDLVKLTCPSLPARLISFGASPIDRGLILQYGGNSTPRNPIGGVRVGELSADAFLDPTEHDPSGRSPK